MKKKTPKSSNRKRARQKEKRDRIIIAGIFIVFAAILAFLFYFIEFSDFGEDAVVAVVNGKEITRSELDWWYHTSILPEHREIISKEDFLEISLIPQEVLLQKAEDERIKVTDDEVEKSLGLYIIENGLTLDEFEIHLESRGITLDQIKKSFEIKARILKLLESEDIYVDPNDPEAFFGRDVHVVQEYIDELMEDVDIEIFEENVNKLVLSSFEETGEDVCGEDRLIVRLYTTSKCEVCEDSGKIFENLVEKFDDGGIDVAHWKLDTGDNLLTEEKENGVPGKEVELFKKYGKGKVPAVVIGCKYKLIGTLDGAEDEFNDIIKDILGE